MKFENLYLNKITINEGNSTIIFSSSDGITFFVKNRTSNRIKFLKELNIIDNEISYKNIINWIKSKTCIVLEINPSITQLTVILK